MAPVLARLEAQTRVMASITVAQDLCNGKVWTRHTANASEEKNQTLRDAACDHLGALRTASGLIQPRRDTGPPSSEWTRLIAALTASAAQALAFCEGFAAASRAELHERGVKQVIGATGCQSLVIRSVRTWARNAHKAGSGG